MFFFYFKSKNTHSIGRFSIESQNYSSEMYGEIFFKGDLSCIWSFKKDLKTLFWCLNIGRLSLIILNNVYVVNVVNDCE